MSKLYVIVLISILLSSCETISKKTDSIVDKENKKLSFFIGKKEEVLYKSMGKPYQQTTSDMGYKILFYKDKKYGIFCKREFEVDESGFVVGYKTRGCI